MCTGTLVHYEQTLKGRVARPCREARRRHGEQTGGADNKTVYACHVIDHMCTGARHVINLIVYRYRPRHSTHSVPGLPRHKTS